MKFSRKPAPPRSTLAGIQVSVNGSRKANAKRPAGQISRHVGSSISLKGPVVLVSPQVVQPLSLIIHELALNALTHGSLSRSGNGSLSISWTSGAGKDDDRLHVGWDERGAKHAAIGARGFGTVILGALVEKQLRGSFTHNRRDDGLTIGLDVMRK